MFLDFWRPVPFEGTGKTLLIKKEIFAQLEEIRLPILIILPGLFPRAPRLQGLSKAFGAREQVDGGDFTHELIGLFPPPEFLGIKIADRLQQSESGQIGFEAFSIRHMNLCAAADLSRMLLKGRLKIKGTENTALQSKGFEGSRETKGVDEGGAEDLERTGGAAALGELGGLQEAHTRIDEGRLRRRHVG